MLLNLCIVNQRVNEHEIETSDNNKNKLTESYRIWLVVCTFLIRRMQIRKSWRFLLLGYEESTSAHINDLHIRILI